MGRVRCSKQTHVAREAWKNTPKEKGGIGPITHPLLADVKKEAGFHKEANPSGWFLLVSF